jgi:hypothetical protein
MATARDRKEYLKQWRTKNADHIKRYREDKYSDYAQHMIDSRLKNPERFIHSRAKSRAKTKGLDFDLDKSDIIIPKLCPILGIPIIREHIKGRKPGPTPNSPSIDRINNKKGYIKGNIMIISHKANTMKHDASPEELLRFARWIINTYEETYEEHITE